MRIATCLALAALVTSPVAACRDDGNIQRVDRVERRTRLVGQLRNGRKHGQWLRYFDGRLWELETWRNGIEHGPFFGWHPNGRLSYDGMMRHGVAAGRQRQFYDDGQIAAIYWIEHGRKVHVDCDWEPDGRVERIIEYGNDVRLYEDWYPRRPCPATEGVGRRHIDPGNTEYER